MSRPQVPPGLLGVAWVHAHEEDLPGERVYRPAGHALPPSRGRAAFTLEPDGTLVERGPGPADRPTRATGRWSLEPDGSLTLTSPGASAPRRLVVLRVEPDRLVLGR